MWGYHTEVSAEEDGWMNLGSRKGLELETGCGILSTYDGTESNKPGVERAGKREESEEAGEMDRTQSHGEA